MCLRSETNFPQLTRVRSTKKYSKSVMSVRPLRAKLREAQETGADEKKLDGIRAKIHYRLTQLASFQGVGDRKQYLKRPTECVLGAWRPQHFGLHTIQPLTRPALSEIALRQIAPVCTCTCTCTSSGTLLLPRK